MAGLTLQQLQAMGAKPASTGGLTLAQLQTSKSTATPAKDPFNPFPTTSTPQNLSDLVWQGLTAYGGAVKKAAQGGADQINQGVSTIERGTTQGGVSAVQGAEAGLQTESGIASIISSPLAPLFAPVGMAINAIGDQVSNIPAVQKFAASPAGQTTERVAGDLANAGNVAGTILGADKAVTVAQTLPTKISNAVSTVKKALTPSPVVAETQAPSINSTAVLDAYNKAIKPTVAGKTGAGQLDAYNKNVVSAVKAITKNKDTLTFETDAGSEAGRLPQTRGELADALAQTKQSIFKQYDALAQQAGEKGVEVPLDKAGTALDDVVNNQALQITNPRAVEYAKAIQSRLQNADGTYKTITPDVAQQAITNLNSSLKAFYRNPSYDSASNAAIDAGVVNHLREALDHSILESEVGAKVTGIKIKGAYQSLKDQYGALSAIEKDVNKAAIAQAKATGTNTMGLGKYVDVFSGGDMVSGLLSLNPALFAKGVAQSGISHFFQWFNSPDRAVGTMFKNAPSVAQPK